jgi:hypothetical protein
MAQGSVKAQELGKIPSSQLTTSYQSINLDPGFTESCFMIRIYNGGSTDVTISFDGHTDQEYLKAGADLILQTQTNSQPAARLALWSKGTYVSVKGTAGTGNIYLSAYYV